MDKYCGPGIKDGNCHSAPPIAGRVSVEQRVCLESDGTRVNGIVWDSCLLQNIFCLKVISCIIHFKGLADCRGCGAVHKNNNVSGVGAGLLRKVLQKWTILSYPPPPPQHKRKNEGGINCGRPTGHNFGHPLDRKQTFFMDSLVATQAAQGILCGLLSLELSPPLCPYRTTATTSASLCRHSQKSNIHVQSQQRDTNFKG